MTEAKIRPVKGKKNVLITSALPYVNNVPHLGNLIGSVLSADVFSRYSKLRGNPTLYICGTDEYGTATETKALEEHCTPQELCDRFHKKHKEIYDFFQLGFDYFGRTTTEKHTEIVQDVFTKLWNNGNFEERVTVQPYCENHHAFLADRFVEGTCPKCGGDARGDQCDHCGALLDPFELINPRCKVCKIDQSPAPRETKHIFLLLDKLQPKVDDWFNKAKKDWSANGIAITKSWLDKGLEGRSITRDLKWGIPIPLPDYENKVIYVWFDACIGYPSITASYDPEHWEEWWKNPENVTLYQFLGKDNTPFHAVTFPACQLGSGDNWTMVSNISTTEYLNYEGGKFSKSRSVGVFGDQAKDTQIPSDVWRYYLLSSRPETGDTQFEWAAFVTCNNSVLLANFGNFVNRVIKFVNAKFGGKIMDYDPSYADESFDFSAWREDVNRLLKEYLGEMDKVRLRAGIEKTIAISSLGNSLLQYRLDNAALAEHPERTHTVIGLALSLCSLLASLASPYMPTTAQSISKQLNIELQPIPDTFDTEMFVKAGHQIGKAAYLFSRIDEKKIGEWKDKYGGTAESRAAEAGAKAKKQAEKDRKKAKRAAEKAAAAAAATEGNSTQAGPSTTGGAAAPLPEPYTAATEEARELPIREKPAEK